MIRETILHPKGEPDVDLYPKTNASQVADLYPVGSIYISTVDISPASIFGGDWVRVPTGYYLCDSNTSGEKLNATLPNIKGEILSKRSSANEGIIFAHSGAFNSTRLSGMNGNTLSSNESKWNSDITVFNANAYNPVYIDGAGVRPLTYTVHMWERVG